MKQQYLKENERNIFEDPEIRYLKSIDEDLKKVLNEPCLPPEVKYKKYMDLFTKYNTVMDNVTKPFEIEMRPKVTEAHRSLQPANEIQQPAKYQQATTQTIINKEKAGEKQAPSGKESSGKVPAKTPMSPKLKNLMRDMRTTERTKATKILDTLKQDPRINWDNDGYIYFKNRFVKGSDIAETIKDLTKVRKNTRPGFTEVSSVLLDNKIPWKNITNYEQYHRISQNINKKSVKEIMGQYEDSDMDLDDEDEYISAVDEQRDDEEDNLNKTFVQKGTGVLFNYLPCKWHE
jgi:hypothetical protein